VPGFSPSGVNAWRLTLKKVNHSPTPQKSRHTVASMPRHLESGDDGREARNGRMVSVVSIWCVNTHANRLVQ
jgi:hypothetical protein